MRRSINFRPHFIDYGKEFEDRESCPLIGRPFQLKFMPALWADRKVSVFICQINRPQQFMCFFGYIMLSVGISRVGRQILLR